MAECRVGGCQRRVITGDLLCGAHYLATCRGGSDGVGAEEAARRRKQYAERLAGCPLELWLKQRRPTFKTAVGTGGRTYTSCGCDCHDEAA